MTKVSRLARHYGMRERLNNAQATIALAHADLATLTKNAWAKMNDEDMDGELPTGIEPPKDPAAMWFITNALTLHWRLSGLSTSVEAIECERMQEEEQVHREKNGAVDEPKAVPS
jgi:hypothetical protein